MCTPNYASPEQLQGAGETTATDVYSLGAVLHKILTGYSPSENTKSLTSLPIDLQYILRKALRTEPEERYDSAEALANDLRAFLEWKPVQARSGDTWYRARKFVRRYRVPVLVTVLLIAGLSVGLYAVNRERKIAQRRFDRVTRVAALKRHIVTTDLIATFGVRCCMASVIRHPTTQNRSGSKAGT